MLEDDPADPNDGGWVVAWVSNPVAGGTHSDPQANIYMQRFNADGVAVGGELLVNQTTY
ncbi:hypothetical protein [Microvirga roseola]|uniref:hypothetical protein n=1 Tax=Microvirga roseola TaxID=2883126 RepID=UPI001E36CFDA|nr:hypothetical protein [Microvirga roseola]